MRNGSVLPTAPTALPLHGFGSGYSSSIDKFGRNFRRLSSWGEQNCTPQNPGETLDKSRFSGNKSLHEENDLMEKTFVDPLPANFTSAEISRLPPACHWSCFDLFFILMGELDR